jgi:glyoxylase I family protein
MFTIRGLDHLVLKTNNLDHMIKFYCEILNFKIERVQKEFNLTQLRVGDNLIDLVKVKNKPDLTQSNLEHFCLRIQPFNYEELKDYFTKQGIEVKRYGERYSALGLGWSFYINDPDGNEIELVAANE